MIVIALTITIGNQPGQYPAGTTVTDSLFGQAEIFSLARDSQVYMTGWRQNGSTLDMDTLPALINGDVVGVTFKTAITIE